MLDHIHPLLLLWTITRSNKHMQLEKQKRIYPVLEKVLHSAKDEFRTLQAAYSAEELRKHEERLATGSWDASFLPSIVHGARLRLAEKAKRSDSLANTL